MSELRPIETASFAKAVVPETFGKPPRLEWIAIAQLVIDPAYQRDITRESRTNVRRIAAAFDWSKFAPVIVASAGSDRFAIVDGQHRTTAAALCGIDRVPCAIIDATRAQQAAAFRAINGNITRISGLALHHAAVAAGEPPACAIHDAVSAAKCVVLRYPKPWGDIRPGETMAIGAIDRALRAFGAPMLVLALRAIRETCDGNAGMLRVQTIFGTAEVLADHSEWHSRPARLIAAFEHIDLPEMLERARRAHARERGTSIIDQFEALLLDALSGLMKQGAA